MSNKMNAYGFVDSQLDKALPEFEKREREIPSPDNRQVLVEVKATAVNPTDLATRSMKDPSDESFTILGRDVSGVVVDVGSEVSLFKKGYEVFYPGTSEVEGAQADFHVIDERMAALKPKNLSFPEAAALPLTALTSYEVIHDRLQLFDLTDNPKETTLLIVGAAGGVGSVASQLALNYGFTVIGTASREESTQYIKELGIKHVINHKEPFDEQLKDIGFDSVDAVFIAAKADDNIKDAGKVVKPQGRVCSLLPLQNPLPLSFFGKSILFSYELMYTRSVYQTSDWIKQHEYLTELRNQVEQGFIKSTLSKHFTKMNEQTIKEAFEALMSEHTVGKIVLENSK